MMKFKRIKEILSLVVAVSLVGAFSVQCVKAAAVGFNFVFNGANGDIYCYSEAQLKKNNSSAFVYYYPTSDASVSMSVVGYNGSYVENIQLANKIFQPGQTGYVENWIIESGLAWGCLRGEATIDYLYYGSGTWNINSQ